MIEQLLNALDIGSIYGLVAIGVYLTFRVINFADLTVDGSFTLGASITTIMIINGYNPWLALIMATISGMCAGLITSILHTKFKITDLLSGILVMTGMYSINLMIMGSPNLSIPDNNTIFNFSYPLLLLIGIMIISVIKFILLIKSSMGLNLRTVGMNPDASSLYGINVNMTKGIAIVISNGIVAFAGALFAQLNGFVDISMGTGTIIIGIAAIIIGETITARFPAAISITIIGCVLGSVIYRVAVVTSLNLEFIKSYHLNLLTAVIITAIIITPSMLRRNQ